jgi:hypothetical protein
MIFVGEGSLRRALAEFLEHYHEERNHQALENEMIVSLNRARVLRGAIQRKQRLGVMSHYYYQEAAGSRREGVRFQRQSIFGQHAVDGFLRRMRHLIYDRDPLFTKRSEAILRSPGIKSVELPPRSPNLNVCAERFLRSIKSECLDRTIPLGEAYLRRVLEDYAAPYHRERNHEGIDNQIIGFNPGAENGQVKCRKRLGGMPNYYHRDAARTSTDDSSTCFETIRESDVKEADQERADSLCPIWTTELALA